MSIEMADLQTDEHRTETTVNGMTVRKELRETESGISVVVFKMSNGRDDEVAVHVDERLPDAFSVEKVGLHPEYGSDRWTITEEKLTFEARLEGNGELVTMYGVDVESAEEAKPFLTEPQVKTTIPLEDPSGGDGSTDDASGGIDADSLADYFSEPGELIGDVSAGISTSADGGTEIVEAEAESEANESTEEVVSAGDGTPNVHVDEAAREADEAATEAAGGKKDTDEEAGEADEENGAEAIEGNVNRNDHEVEGDRQPDDDVDIEESNTTRNGATDPTETAEADAAEGMHPADNGAVELDEPSRSNGASDAINPSGRTDGEQADGELSDESDEGGIEEENGSSEAQGDALTRDDLLSRLVDQLEERTLSSRERSVLVEALGVDKVNTLDARLRRTQRTVEDLAAYEDALAEFIEHNGGAAEVIEELRTEIEELRDDVGSIEGQLAETHEEVTALQSDLDATSTAVKSVRDSVEELEADQQNAVAGLENELDNLEGTVRELSTSHESAIHSLESDVKSFRDWQRSLSEAIELPSTEEE